MADPSTGEAATGPVEEAGGGDSGGAETSHGSSRSAQWVAGGILLSRLTGLVRQRVFARFFGAGIAADAFTAASRMPNVLQNLLGEGTLSASFIPVYSELLAEGRDEEAGRVAGAVFALLLALAGAVTLLGVIAAPVMVDVLTTGFSGEQRDLTITCVRIIFPMTGVLVLSAWALGILNSHRRFFIPYVAPVLWNAAMIATMLLLGGRMEANRLVIALAWGALIGGFLQFGIQLPWVLKLERDLKIRWDTKLPRVRTAVMNAGPVVLGRGVVQLSAYVDIWLASFLAAGSVAILQYSLTLYLLPISLFGMSVAAAELPELSRGRTGELEALRLRVNTGLRQIAFFVVPSFVGYLAVGDVVVAALYQNGDFDPSNTWQVYFTLIALSLGLLASTSTRLFSSTYYALQDTKTPAKYAAVRVVISGGLGAALMFPFSRLEVAPGAPLGVVGLAVGAGVAAWIEWWMLRRTLQRKLEGSVGAGATRLTQMFIAALTAAGVARGVAYLLPPLHVILRGVLVLTPFVITYFAVAALLGLPQARLWIRRVLRRNG